MDASLQYRWGLESLNVCVAMLCSLRILVEFGVLVIKHLGFQMLIIKDARMRREPTTALIVDPNTPKKSNQTPKYPTSWVATQGQEGPSKDCATPQPSHTKNIVVNTRKKPLENNLVLRTHTTLFTIVSWATLLCACKITTQIYGWLVVSRMMNMPMQLGNDGHGAIVGCFQDDEHVHIVGC